MTAYPACANVSAYVSITGWKENDRGNTYEKRYYGENAMNKNAYAYRNSDGSTYVVDGNGRVDYTDVGGGGWFQLNIDGPRHMKQ